MLESKTHTLSPYVEAQPVASRLDSLTVALRKRTRSDSTLDEGKEPGNLKVACLNTNTKKERKTHKAHANVIKLGFEFSVPP